MSTAQKPLPSDVRTLLDAHLDAVDRALAASEMSRAERREICDEVETQALEMLWQRAASPRAGDIRAVLAELDPPEAYRQTAAADEPATLPPPEIRRTLNRYALAALLVPTATIGLILLGLGPRGEGPMIVFAVFISMVSIVLGTIGIKQIRREPARWSGLESAVSGAMLLPLTVLGLFAFLFADGLKTRFFDVPAANIRQYDRAQKEKASLAKQNLPELSKAAVLAELDKQAPPTELERSLASWQTPGTGLTYLIVMSVTGLLTLALPWSVIRWLRP